jgi:hypothetical protein
MKINLSAPSTKACSWAIAIIIAFSVFTAVFVGYRSEHALFTLLFCALFFPNEKTRKLAVGLLPFIVYGVLYDVMRIFPNYRFNAVDVEPLYNLEKIWFGITEQGMKLIPGEYFTLHGSHPIVDFLTGVFYLGWVPLPMLFGVYLYWTGKKEFFIRFAMAFLVVNILGFIGYYLHPAAPPWYATLYGFDVATNTVGNAAGLSRFDALTGIPIFNTIYVRNANVFAALPSLHSTYLLITLYYAVKSKCNALIISIIALFMCGIWFTAVYTLHHYVIDVGAGILCAAVGITLFEYGGMKIPAFKSFFTKYVNYIS